MPISAFWLAFSNFVAAFFSPPLCVYFGDTLGLSLSSRRQSWSWYGLFWRGSGLFFVLVRCFLCWQIHARGDNIVSSHYHRINAVVTLVIITMWYKRELKWIDIIHWAVTMQEKKTNTKNTKQTKQTKTQSKQPKPEQKQKPARLVVSWSVLQAIGRSVEKINNQRPDNSDTQIFANELVASHSFVVGFLCCFCFLFVCLLLSVLFFDDDGLLDYVQVLHQFSFVALNSRRPRVLIWNYCFCNAIKRVKRPGESHEGVGRKKNYCINSVNLHNAIVFPACQLTSRHFLTCFLFLLGLFECVWLLFFIPSKSEEYFGLQEVVLPSCVWKIDGQTIPNFDPLASCEDLFCVKVWWEDVQCTDPPWTYVSIFKPILEQCMCRWTVRKPF